MKSISVLARNRPIRLQDAACLLVAFAVTVVAPLSQAATVVGQAIRGHTLAGVNEDLPFVRGDSNFDAAVDISDAVASLGALFLSNRPELLCDDAADSNDDGVLDISDPIHTLAFLFMGGVAPATPFPTRGTDSTLADTLRCTPLPTPDRWVFAVRPLRCPDADCDPWVVGTEGAVSAEEHVDAFASWATAAGAQIMAIWSADTPSASLDFEAFEIVAVIDGSSVASVVLEANTRLILAPPGVLKLSMWPMGCGFNAWGGADGDHPSAFRDWATRLSIPSRPIIHSAKLVPVPPGEEDPTPCDCDSALPTCREDSLLEVVFESDHLGAWLMNPQTSPRLETRALFPAEAKLVRASALACDVEPWAEWWVGEHRGAEAFDLEQLAAWLVAMNQSAYHLFSVTHTGFAGPTPCGFAANTDLYVVVPCSSVFLNELGFETVWP